MLNRARLRALIDTGDDEQGSMIVALTIIMIVVMIGSALFARVVGDSLTVVTEQNNSAALSAAEAGIADALFRIDNGAAGTFCLSTSDPACAVTTALPATPGASYVATRNSDTKWTIDALGTSGKMQAAAQETVTRAAAFPYALFGNTGLTFNGNGSNNTTLDTYLNGPVTSSPANPDPSGNVGIGSNGTIQCNPTNGLPSNVTATYFTGGGGITGSCGTANPVGVRYTTPIPSYPPANVVNLGCPNGGMLGSNNGVPSLSPGTYLCENPVTIDGTLSMVGPGTVYLYIILDLTQYGATSNTLTITSNSNVNVGPGVTASPPTGNMPDARLFQVLSNSDGYVGVGTGQGYNFGGILNAPNAKLTGDGCKSNYYGALVVNTFTCNGSSNHLSINYQSNLQQLYGSWSPAAFAQIPASSVHFP